MGCATFTFHLLSYKIKTKCSKYKIIFVNIKNHVAVGLILSYYFPEVVAGPRTLSVKPFFTFTFSPMLIYIAKSSKQIQDMKKVGRSGACP